MQMRSEPWKQNGGGPAGQLGLHHDQVQRSEPGLHTVPVESQVLGPGVEAGGQGKATATFLVEMRKAETIAMGCG